MVEIIDTLINILCQQGTQTRCSQFISSYPDVTQQIVWLVFFPSVFLLLFIIFIASGVVREHRKYTTLLAIAIYLFVVFQGWYHFFLNLSKFWFIGVIILGGIFVVTHKMGAAGGGGGGGGGRAAARQLSASGIGKYAVDTIRGRQKHALSDLKEMLERRARLVGKTQKYLKEPAEHRMDLERTELAIKGLDDQIETSFNANRWDPVIGPKVLILEKQYYRKKGGK